MKKINQRNLVLFGCLLSAVVGLGIYFTNNNGLDYHLMKLIQQNNIFVHNDLLFSIVKAITFLSNSIYFIILIPILIMVFYKNKKVLFHLIILFIIVFICNELIKMIIQRERPLEFFRITMHGFSYPSGHAMIGSFFYLRSSELLAQATKYNFIRFIGIIISILIGLSRIILGVHWPSDVLIGFIIGFITHYATLEYIKK